MRRAASLILGVLLASGLPQVAPGAEAQRPFAAFGPTGHAWSSWTEAEKLRYLEGFLAGRALAEAAATGRSVDQLRRDGALAFPFAPNVYKTRLEDYFFYTDRREQPLHEALAAVNEQIRQGQRR